jgi:hypothetical protein
VHAADIEMALNCDLCHIFMVDRPSIQRQEANNMKERKCKACIDAHSKRFNFCSRFVRRLLIDVNRKSPLSYGKEKKEKTVKQ